MPDKRKKVTFVKTKKVKKGDFKGIQKGVKSKEMSEKRALKKQAKGQGFISKVYGSNPIEMSPYKMESAGQEKYNLLHDMPLDKDATGGRSWMSKHSKSAFQMGHSPAEMGHDSPAKHKGSGYGTKHEEEVGHGDGTGMHSHAYGRQKKQDEGKERSEKRKKVKATIKAGKAIAKSM